MTETPAPDVRENVVAHATDAAPDAAATAADPAASTTPEAAAATIADAAAATTADAAVATTADDATARPLSFRRRLRRFRRRVSRRLVIWFGPFLLRRLSRTWKVTVLGAENLEAARGKGGGCLLAMWHGRMLLGVAHYGSQEWHVLVSGSQDGDISHALLEAFRYRVIRGSTSRGGARALREMLAALERGAMLVITPDGPRGPRHSMNPGLAWMARATGYAVVPWGLACDRAWHARSWDRFTLPKPGAQVAFAFADPVRVERGASPADLEAATERIRAGIMSAEQRAFDHLRKDPDW